MTAKRRSDSSPSPTAERCVAIVQARLGSTRLPGKMLLDLCAHPVLHWVLARAKLAREIDGVVLATTTAAADAALLPIAEALRIPCFRGDEKDVLGRILGAAREHDASVVVRICADNPLIAPEEIDRLVRFYRNTLATWGDSDRLYAHNAVPDEGNGYPDGLGAEIFSTSLLSELDAAKPSADEREHVTTRFRSDHERYEVVTFSAPRDVTGKDIKLDIDTHEELERMRTLCAHLSLDSSAAAIVRTYRELFGTLPRDDT